MFEVTLTFVPPGGGEADYSLRMRVPALPRAGDYITVMRKYASPPDDKHTGTEDFIVRRVWWGFEYPDDGKHYHEAGKDPVGEVSGITIECEFAIGPYSSKAHRDNTPHKARAEAQTFEASAY